jgi:hypothetical protein
MTKKRAVRMRDKMRRLRDIHYDRHNAIEAKIRAISGFGDSNLEEFLSERRRTLKMTVHYAVRFVHWNNILLATTSPIPAIQPR